MKEFLDKIFKLPPVEKRPDIRHSFIKKIVCPITAAVSDKGDTYIYYQVGLWSLYVSFFLALPFAVAYSLGQDLDFYFFTVNVPDADTMADVFKQYVSVTQSLLLYGLFPFFLFKFRWNVNPKKYDVLWPSNFYAGRGKRTRRYILSRVIFGLIIFGAAYRYFHLFIYFWGSERLEFLILTQILVSYAHSLFTLAFFTGSIILWRYIGKYEGR